MPNAKPLVFKVAPHILEDFGLNLYSDLSRVLVEYVANSHDADSKSSSIIMDEPRIIKERAALRAQWQKEYDAWTAACDQWEHAGPLSRGERPTQPNLESRCLPDDVTIVIEDDGDGMRREDVQDKFLVAGRRRRGKDNSDTRSAGNRILMGRKGLGKLAGFGVARVVTIVTRAKGEPHATKIALRYDDIIQVANTNDVQIEEEKISSGGGFKTKGTRVILSQLTYGPTGTKSETIAHRVADHFAQIDPSEFAISMNKAAVSPTKRTFKYAWPEPAKASTKLIDEKFTTEDGREFTYRYRLRFTEERSALTANERGVRVYVNRRLAASPSLLGADTNMHGFRMTDYLDGVVHADFIDQQREDYIATDRQSLKWETPLLQPLYLALSTAIRTGCYERQKVRDEEMEQQISKDRFTLKAIDKAGLSNRERTAAIRIGRALASLHKKGAKDNGYKQQFGEVITAMGRGEILAQLSAMAKIAHPELQEVIAHVTRLTAEQRDGFYSYVKGRMDAITALKKIVEGKDFAGSKNEKELHALLESNSWLIDPTYFELVTSNRSEKTMYRELEQALKINDDTPKGFDPDAKDQVTPGADNTRPDLVFVLGDTSGSQIVIVELKAPNTPLWGEHYRQLQGYITDTKKWVKSQHRTASVSGILVGSFGKLDSRAREVEWLHEEMEKTNNVGELRVLSISKLLEDAQRSHHDMIQLWKSDGKATTKPAAKKSSRTRVKKKAARPKTKKPKRKSKNS